MIFKTTDDGERIISFFNKAKIESENFAKQLEKDKIFLTEYFNATGDVAKQQAILNKSTNDASKNAIEYAVSTKGAAGSVSNFEQQQIKANASIQKSKKYFDLSTISANVYKLAIKGITIAANMATSALLSGVVYAFSKLFTAQNEAIEKAKELTSTYKSNNTSLEDYKEQINTLVTELNSSNISYEDSKTKRKELMSIQDELFKKYGTEEEVIKSITAAINGEVDALDTLSQKSYYEWLASVDSLTGAQKFGDGFFKIFTGISDQYKSALDSAVDYMEDKTQFFYVKTTGNEELDKLIQEKFGLYKNAFNEFVIKDIVPEEAYELLGQIRTAYRDNASEYLGTETDNILTNTNDSIQSAMTTIDAELGKHQETYHTYLEGMIKYDSEYSDEYADLLSKRALLEEADLSTTDEGKQQRVLEAKKAFYDSLSNAITSAENNDNVKRYFENLYPDLYSKISSWNFEYSISANTDEIADTAKEISEKYTATDLLNMVNTKGVQDGEASFNSLIDKAIEYGVCTDKSAEQVQKLIDLLIELGIVQGEVQGSASNSESGTSPLSISSTIDQLNTQLKPAFDSLQSAYQDIFTDDGKFALNSIDILSTCDTIKSKLDEMSDPEGLNLDVDYSAFEDFVSVLNNTASTEYDVETAFDSLATSITRAALSGAEDFDTMKAALEDLGVVNSEMVAFDALISNAEALKEAFNEAGLEGLDIRTVNDDDIEAFTKGIVSAENYSQAVNLLKIQKILCAENPLDTSGDIMSLYLLANAAGIATDAITHLMTLNAAYEKASAEGDTAAALIAKGKMEVVKQNIANQFAHLGDNVDFGNIGGGKASAGKAGSDAGKSYKEGLEEELSDLNSVISGITKSIDDQMNAIGEQKDTALDAIEAQINALEEERDARLAVIDAQKAQLEEEIESIDTKIKSKQDEIDAINDAAEARKREIDLQKAQYNLERMQNQRTILQYSKDKGMHYVADEQGMRDARADVDEVNRQIEIADIEKEIDLLESQSDLLREQIDLLDKQADKINEFYDAQIQTLEKQKEETEKYFESLTKALEDSKSKYTELTEIADKAELSAKLVRLGIDEQALLSGSEEEFQKLKTAYMDTVFQLNEGNAQVLSKLQELSGYGGTAPALLSDSNSALDIMNGKLNISTQSVDTVNNFLGQAAAITSETAANVGTLEANLGSVSTLITDELTAFTNLKAAIDEVIAALNLKIQAIQEAQAAAGIATTTEIAYFLLLKEKIDELKQNIIGINDAVTLIDRQPIDNLTDSFQKLYDKILLISTTLGSDIKGQGAGMASGIASAIQEFNKISFEKGIVAQFTNLKTAIDSVTAAISGGGESSGGEGQGSSSSVKGSKSAGKSAGGEGTGGNSLTSAITEVGTTVDEVIGEPDTEGDGTVIGAFESLETAVNDVTSAIGCGDSKENEEKSADGEDEGNLISSITGLGDTTEEILGESGGDGVIGRFEQFKEPIAAADKHVHSISKGLNDIDGTEVECKIKVHVETDGSTGFTGSDQALGAMNLTSAEYTAAYSRKSLYDPNQDDSMFGELYRAWNTHYGNHDKGVETIAKTLSQHLVMEHSQQMTKEISRINSSNTIVNNSRGYRQPVTVQIGDIHLTGVQDVSGLAQAIKTHLPGQMMQEYFKN